MSEEILEQVVAQDGETVVDSHMITSSPPPEEAVRSEVEEKVAEKESKEFVVYFPNFLQDSVVPLLKYSDGKREKYAISKDIEFYV